MPYDQKHANGGSVVVPILLVVFALAISIAIARQQIATTKLAKTDHIACAFLKADADVRALQANNAAKTAVAQKTFISRTEKLRGIFVASAAKHHTEAASAPLLSYLDAQAKVITVSREQSLKNIKLTRRLADEGHLLASQLHC